MESNQMLWVEKYRPHKIEDCILPDSIKTTFQELVKLQSQKPSVTKSDATTSSSTGRMKAVLTHSATKSRTMHPQ
jgi:hypothetical protein